MELSLKEKIAVHVCYRDIFNAPVSQASLCQWLGIAPNNEDYLFCINEMIREGSIEKKDGYLTVRGKSAITCKQPAKDAMTEEMIRRGSWLIRILGKIPFIRFIGVSGSVAAKNPTTDVTGINQGAVDLDLFVITTRNSLWLVFFFERVFTAIYRVFHGYHFYCFNYVTDEDFLEIDNQNFYTATEVNNVVPLVDKNVYWRFLAANAWCRQYYANHSLCPLSHQAGWRLGVLLAPVNLIMFTLAQFTRVIKRRSLLPLKDLNFRFNGAQRHNVNRISAANGGYQKDIVNRFEKGWNVNFPAYKREGLMEYLFPKHAQMMGKVLSEPSYERSNTEVFAKYLSTN